MVSLCDRRPELSGTGRTEGRLGTESSSMRGRAPLANLVMAWRSVDCDVTRIQNIPLINLNNQISSPDATSANVGNPFVILSMNVFVFIGIKADRLKK